MTQYMQEAGAMKQADEQREAFEAWAKTANVGSVGSFMCEAAWKGYCAALAAALPPAAVQAWQLIDPQGRVMDKVAEQQQAVIDGVAAVAPRYEGRCFRNGDGGYSMWEPLTKVEYERRKNDELWEVREVPPAGVTRLDAGTFEPHTPLDSEPTK